MIRRVVKMTFREDMTSQFLENFHRNKAKIRAFKGCQHLELWQAKKEENVFFTFSIWNSEDDLNAYRASELFGGVWKTTKAMFSEKPQAWSVDQVATC
ncbi:MAG: antibiotic biosynthesis monooxygenase [Flavobacteriales bacterium]|nr:antibiotic biosynthesis monooxygenase [Flavobacteriales bacterium]